MVTKCNKCDDEGNCHTWHGRNENACSYFIHSKLSFDWMCKYMREDQSVNGHWFCDNNEALLAAKLETM